tara:strand:+ start:718 stop:1911 length:1194 start_codon:yes stop_codon:yes gene_type:complete
MQLKKSFLFTASLILSLLLILGIAQQQLQSVSTAASNGKMVPHFEVDPFWPQPLPNKWILGSVIGVDVDERDHVFIVHRTDDSNFRSAELGIDNGISDCCTAAPPILEFDADGSLVNAWGGPGQGYTWPSTNHGIEIAPNGDVWIGGNGSGDSHIVVFSRDGEFIREVGLPGEDIDSNSMIHFNQVAEIAIDPVANEAYVADGYGNKRVVVVDVATGDFKRYWGAYGNQPSDDPVTYTPGEPLPQQFRGPVHCAQPSQDGLLYVCDRGADRIQVFRTDGTFIKEAQIAPMTVGAGATWDIAFSHDDDQEFIYVADGSNMKVHVVHRDSLEVMYVIGEGGRQPGLFFGTHSIASDSQGNFYTTETYEGKRVQKFTFQGLRDVAQLRSGPSWPAGTLLD